MTSPIRRPSDPISAPNNTSPNGSPPHVAGTLPKPPSPTMPLHQHVPTTSEEPKKRGLFSKMFGKKEKSDKTTSIDAVTTQMATTSLRPSAPPLTQSFPPSAPELTQVFPSAPQMTQQMSRPPVPTSRPPVPTSKPPVPAPRASVSSDVDVKAAEKVQALTIINKAKGLHLILFRSNCGCFLYRSRLLL